MSLFSEIKKVLPTRLVANFSIIFYAFGIIVSFVARELIIDAIYSKNYGPQKERFKFSIFIVFLQSIINCIFAIIFPIFQRYIFRPKIEVVIEEPEKNTKKDSKIPNTKRQNSDTHERSLSSSSSSSSWLSWMQVYFEFSIPAIAQVAAGYVGNKSMEFVDGTTKTVAKSIKPIPIMILGFLFRGERYHYLRYIAILMVTLGMAVFMLELQSGKTKKEEITNGWIGLLFCGIGLFLDGIVGTTQDSVREKYHPSASALMFSTNVWATILSIIPLWYWNEGTQAFNFCTKYPEVFQELFLFAVACPIGNHFIFLMLYEFGSLQTSIVTTIRKFLTILVNTLWLGRSMTYIQILSVIVVFAGLELDNRGKKLEKITKKE